MAYIFCRQMAYIFCRQSQVLDSQAHSSQVTELTNAPSTDCDKMLSSLPATVAAVVSAESTGVHMGKEEVKTIYIR